MIIQIFEIIVMNQKIVKKVKNHQLGILIIKE